MQHVRFYVRLFCRCVQERWRTCRPGREFGFMLRDFFPEKERKRKRKGGMGVEGKKKKREKEKKNSDNNRAPRLEKYFSELIRAYLPIDCTKICIPRPSCFIRAGCRALDDERDTIFSRISLLLLKFCLIYIAFYL